MITGSPIPQMLVHKLPWTLSDSKASRADDSYALPPSSTRRALSYSFVTRLLAFVSLKELLFFKCLPDKTLSLKGDECYSVKNSKFRLTVLLGTNCTSTYKLRPLTIWKYKGTRCFKDINNLPTEYTDLTSI